MAREDTNLLGAAGEYITAAMLCRLGWAASLTPQGYKGIDIVAVRDDKPPILVQCKAAQAGSSMWIGVDAHAAAVAPANSWCVLMEYHADRTARPDCYVVPLQVVYTFAWAGFANSVHRDTAAGKSPKRKGRGALEPRDFGSYMERWDLLDRPIPDDPPYAFTGRFWDWIKVVGEPSSGVPLHACLPARPTITG